MNDIILIIALGIIAILIVKAIMLIANDIKRMHKDVRRIIEVGFWSQRRGLKTLKGVRKVIKKI